MKKVESEVFMYLVMTDCMEYSKTYHVEEFETIEEAIKYFKEQSNCYYANQIRIYKANELEITFRESEEQCN